MQVTGRGRDVVSWRAETKLGVIVMEGLSSRSGARWLAGRRLAIFVLPGGRKNILLPPPLRGFSPGTLGKPEASWTGYGVTGAGSHRTNYVNTSERRRARRGENLVLLFARGWKPGVVA